MISKRCPASTQRAQKMIDSRPYQSSDELVKRHVIPRIAYDRIAGEITAQ